VPYLGGLAIFLSVLSSIFLFLELDQQLWFIMVGMLLVVLLGIADDVWNLIPWQKLVGQLMIGLYLGLVGIGVDFLNLPLGLFYDFSAWDMNYQIAGFLLSFNILSIFITVLWTMVLMNSINFLDGMDGLAGGVSMISFLIIFFLSITSYVHQFNSALIAIIIVGACLGFLVFNLPQATIFLGDTGSMLLGFMLAVMSIISGSKMATVSLVLGVVLLDLLFVVWGRWRHGKKIWEGDMSHLHHKLMARGWGVWKILSVYYLISAVLGLLALFIPSGLGKLLIGILFMFLFGLFIIRYLEKSKKKL
jgi:UDP-GlcNAc:undecaprenyl-phosphate GlcNAc-1-phosphate transferase